MVKKRKFINKDGVEAIGYDIGMGYSGNLFGDFYFPSDLHLSIYSDVNKPNFDMLAVDNIIDMLQDFQTAYVREWNKFNDSKDKTTEQVKNPKSITDFFRETSFGTARVKEEGKTAKPAKQATKKTSTTKAKAK
jgi:hypothetical protein